MLHVHPFCKYESVGTDIVKYKWDIYMYSWAP